MAISESKKKIVIDNYFKRECDVTTSIKEAFTKGFELGLKKAPIPSAEPKPGYWILDDSDDSMTCDKCECIVYALDMVDGEIHYCPNCGDKKEGITWID